MAGRLIRVTLSAADHGDSGAVLETATFRVEDTGDDREDIAKAMAEIAEAVRHGELWWTLAIEHAYP